MVKLVRKERHPELSVEELQDLALSMRNLWAEQIEEIEGSTVPSDIARRQRIYGYMDRLDAAMKKFGAE